MIKSWCPNEPNNSGGTYAFLNEDRGHMGTCGMNDLPGINIVPAFVCEARKDAFFSFLVLL